MSPQSIPGLRPPQRADTLAVDTTGADTVSLGEAIRSDSTLYALSDPTQLTQFFAELRADLLDSALWLGIIGIGVRVLAITVLAFFAIRIVERVTHRAVRRYEDLPPLHARRQRALTIANLLSSTARYVAWPIALIMILSELNVDVGALIATAGVAGLAIGFGAQTLVKDVISGIFLLFDDTIHVGDRVRVGTDFGIVEHIGVRLLKVRKFDGELLMVPAGELRVFGNTSIGFMRVLVDVSVSYEQDLDTILPVVERVAGEWADDFRTVLLEETPQVLGIHQFGESGVTIRVIVQVMPGEQFAAERELRLRLKRVFDERGIEIPFPRRTLYVRNETSRPPRTIHDPDAQGAAIEPDGSD